MNVVIQITYIAEGVKILQRGSFPLKGRTKEKAAYDFWRELKREMKVDIMIGKIIIDGEDKTEEIKELEKAPFK